MALSGQDVLNAVNKMPLGQKVGVVAGFVILLSAVNWYFFIDPMQTQITQRQGQLRALEDELIQKQSIANNLAQFRHEKEILERRLAQALTEPPSSPPARRCWASPAEARPPRRAGRPPSRPPLPSRSPTTRSSRWCRRTSTSIRPSASATRSRTSPCHKGSAGPARTRAG